MSTSLTFRNAPREDRAGQPVIASEAADILLESMVEEYADLLQLLSQQS